MINCYTLYLKLCLHDTTGCTTGCIA